ncbi:MAG: AGE family epimerase/isomerase [Propionibacteriaceae bacterium]|jgi:mannose/cellobiose epimerase-like protein (N-acyl-D-glucosamine 2-epimerase family)|nr:AGE family epimerase/isomerase [Propionibacteriaceae bacterium]
MEADGWGDDRDQSRPQDDRESARARSHSTTHGWGDDRDWLRREGDRLLAFARGSFDPRGGFAWLDAAGRPELGRDRQLWITCRMTHCFALAHLAGRPEPAAAAPGWAELAAHGVAAISGAFHDPVHGGWFAALRPDGSPAGPAKEAYPQAFVVLAAASATTAGVLGAAELLERALACQTAHFWDQAAGLVVESWDQAFARLDDYRGANANMHTVEAYLAAADASGDPLYRQRALGIAARLVQDQARAHDWRLPEHYTPDWRPLPDYNRERPDDPFRPFGATVGHGLEWSRLLLQLRGALGAQAPDWLLPAAEGLFQRATADGWAVDGRLGFIYTTDWQGRPVIRQRLHWVAAEAVNAAASLCRTTGQPVYADWYQRWWDHIDQSLIDRAGGSWWHELDPANRPAATVWPGKPDIYHGFQATLVPLCPVGVSLAQALKDGLID